MQMTEHPSVVGIKKQIFKWRFEYLSILALKGLSALACRFLVFILLAGILDYFWVFNKDLRLFFLFAFLGLCGLWIYFKASPKAGRHLFKIKGFIQIAQKELPFLSKHLEPAVDFIYSFEKQAGNVSGEFVTEHLKQTASLIKKAGSYSFFKPDRFFKRMAFLNAAFFAATAALHVNNPLMLSRILLPLREEPLESLLLIEPKDGFRLRGSSFELKAAWIARMAGNPVLKIKGHSGSWVKTEWTKVPPDAYRYEIADINEDLFYKLTYKGLESRVYKISLKDYPSFEKISCAVFPPVYAGRRNEVYDVLPPELAVLKGSIIKLNAVSGEKLSRAEFFFSENGAESVVKLKNVSGLAYELNFKAEKDLQYRFSAVSEHGLENPERIFYSIKVVGDNIPEIEIVSPAFEMEASMEDEIRITYAAIDDLGISVIELVREVELHGKILPEFGLVEKAAFFPEKDALKFSGDVVSEFYDLPDSCTVSFYLRAHDHCPEHGQLYGTAGPVKVKIRDFRRKHMESFERILNTKVLMEKILEKQERMAAGSAVLETIEDFIKSWNSLAGHAEKTQSYLKEDPYFNRGFIQEYGLLKDNVKYLNAVKVKETAGYLSSGKAVESAGNLNDLSDFLKKNISKLQEMVNSQYVQDLHFTSQSADSSASNLKKLLQDAKNAGSSESAGWDKLEKMIQRISRELFEMAASVDAAQKYHDIKPDGTKVFQVPLKSAAGLAEMLFDAIKNRELEKALSLAEKLLEKMERTKQVLKEFSVQQAENSKMLGESRKLKEIKKMWKDLYDSQAEALSADTGYMDDFLPRLDGNKAGFFENTLEEQRRLINLAENAKGFPKDLSAGMKKLLKDVSDRKEVENAGKRFEELAEEISKNPGFGELSEIQKQIAARFDVLKNDSTFIGDKDKEFFENAVKEQEGITQTAGILSAKIQEIKKRFALVSDEISARLGEAEGEMRKASVSLNLNRLKSAVEHQAKALEKLEIAGGSMESLMNMQQGIETGASNFLSPGPKAAGGGYGADVSRVNLPDERDYKPPQDLRKKVIESLQERYPKSQKELIEEYFKKISE